ncbi:MAG: flavodoxin [Treponema sp.]|nr:flavodoxin [Treponema sp.]
MKTAVVYYSYDGSTVAVAEFLKNSLQADVFRVETQDEKKRGGLAKYIWGGRQVFTNAKPDLKPLAFNPADYDLLIIGGPVWASSPAPALVSYLSSAKLGGKKLALFLCSKGGNKGSMDKFKALVPDSTIEGTLDLVGVKNDAESGELQLKLSDWIKKLGIAPSSHPAGTGTR